MAGFDGDGCEIDLQFCRANSCLNGGTCVEGLGITTSCNCSAGFEGTQCEIDLPYCRADSCLNGGTCIESLGTAISCNCAGGYDGDRVTQICPSVGQIHASMAVLVLKVLVL